MYMELKKKKRKVRRDKLIVLGLVQKERQYKILSYSYLRN